MIFKQFPPVPYQDELAELIGARPRIRDYIFSEPRLAYDLFFGPCYPAHYRLNGPHQWQGARKVITESWEDTIQATKTRVVVPKSKTKTTGLPLNFTMFSLIMFAIGLLVALVL